MQMSLFLGSEGAFASPGPILGVSLGLSQLQGAMLSWGPPWRGEGLVSGCSPGWTILQLEQLCWKEEEGLSFVGCWVPLKASSPAGSSTGLTGIWGVFQKLGEAMDRLSGQSLSVCWGVQGGKLLPP